MRLEYLLNSIYDTLDKECYLAALSLTLIIPDIWAKNDYPELYKSKGGNGLAYAKWYDEKIAKSEGSSLGSDIKLSLDGWSCWKLRCGLLHNWLIDVDKNLDDELFNYKFKFTITKNRISTGSIIDGENGNKGHINISEDLARFCRNICSVFKHGYLEKSHIREEMEKGEFNFIEIKHYWI